MRKNPTKLVPDEIPVRLLCLSTGKTREVILHTYKSAPTKPILKAVKDTKPCQSTTRNPTDTHLWVRKIDEMETVL